MLKNILIISEDNEYNYNIFQDKIFRNFRVSHILTREKKNVELIKKLNQNVIINNFNSINFLYENSRTIKEKNKEYINTFFKKEFFELLQYYEYEKKFTLKQKKYLLKKTVDSVLNYIAKNKFDIVFFSHIPHDFLELTFIHICKKKNIKVIFTRGLSIPNYYFFSQNIYNIYLTKKIAENKKNNFLYEDIKKNFSNYNTYIKKKTLWQNHELIKIHQKLKFFNIAEINFIIRCFFKFIARFTWLSYKFSLMYIFNKKKFNILFYHSEIDKIFITKRFFLQNINKLKMEKVYFFHDIKKNALIKSYLKLTNKINKNDKFVFFPLWFQPSSTTYPFAGRFKHYLGTIKIISKLLPKNINLYVRESPDIFNTSRHAWTRGLNSRSVKFYSEINKIKNVRLIDYEINDKKLFQKCLFSVSTSDKLGFMALYYNKQIINFGDYVYKYFTNCFQYKNLKKLKNDINFILQKKNKKTASFKKELIKIANNFFYRPKIVGKDNYKIEKNTDYKFISKKLLNLF